jgi:hypothetical protein
MVVEAGRVSRSKTQTPDGLGSRQGVPGQAAIHCSIPNTLPFRLADLQIYFYPGTQYDAQMRTIFL